LLESKPRGQVRELIAHHAAAFSPQYKAATDIPNAVRDIDCLEALAASRVAQVDLLNPHGIAGGADDPRFTIVKLYLANEELVLSDFLPVLENLGLRVFAQDPIDLALPNLGGVRIHSFFVQDVQGARLDVDAVADRLKPALLLLHRGAVENDRLNSLIVTAGLTWREVDLLRTYVNHGLQIGTSSSRNAIINALVSHPSCARSLWQYFQAKFNPLEPAAPPRRRRGASARCEGGARRHTPE
jgi:glutamate dehydrogenase